MSEIFPVCVIGGGSAGTMAALRAVLNNDRCLFFPGTPKDRKRSRAFWVSKVENMPAHFQYKKAIVEANNEVIDWIKESPYSNNLTFKKNLGVISLSKEKNNIFKIVDNKNNTYFSKFVVLCTGVMDVQPEINGSIQPILPFSNVQIADYCLRCDGHHVLNKKLSIIGHTNDAAWVAFILHERYGNENISILTNGKKIEVSESTQRLINSYKIRVITEPIVEVLGNAKEQNLEGYRLSSGEVVDTNFTFISLGMIVYNELALQVGAEVDERGFVVTNEKGLSSVDGFYVAGDLRANAKKQIYTAWDHAVDSADAINNLIRRQRRESLISDIS